MTAATPANGPLSLPPTEQLIELMFDAARTGRDEAEAALLRAGVMPMPAVPRAMPC